MTDEEIARLRALCEAATPGPWQVDNRHTAGFVLTDERPHAPARCGALVAHSSYLSDAAFIAEARTALPRLLDEWEASRRARLRAEQERDALRARVAELEGALKDVAGYLRFYGARDIAQAPADIADEGFEAPMPIEVGMDGSRPVLDAIGYQQNLREAFGAGWDTIHGKRPGAAWADNPWVWVITFRRVP